MIRFVALVALLAVPGLALAAGGGGTKPPKPTATTQTCTNGKVWDAKTKACVDPQHSHLDDETLFGAVREFAYAGQLRHAQAALAEMSDQQDDRVLTYWGFTHRKMGNVARGMEFYRTALTVNPGNILARSYMGQALVEQGDLGAATAQLRKIRAYDGTGTWAEAALNEAITTGRTRDY